MTLQAAANRTSPAIRTLGLAILLTSAGAGAQSSSSAARAQPACDVRELSRSPLTIGGGREMYIEPSAVLPAGNEVLLAGSPNYLYAPGDANEARAVVQDSVFGAVMDARGRGRLVPAPIDSKRIADVRGIARPEGGWALTFAELRNPWSPPAPDTVVRFWYGVYDGRSWTRLEPLPLPPAGELTTAGASGLLVRGDTSFFAVRVMQPLASASVALYRRRQGAWDVTMLPPSGAAYATLAYHDSTGLVVGLVRPDRTSRYDVNSFFMHTGQEWRTARKLIQGAPEPVHETVLAASPAGPVLTWIAAVRGRRHARAMVGGLTPDSPVISLDSSSQRVVYLERLRESPVWLSAHVGARGDSELRFLALGQRDDAVLLARFPNPYTGWFGAAAVTVDDVLISGPLLRRESANPSLVTLLIRARVECAVRAPRSDGSTLARRVYVHPPHGGLDDFLSETHDARPLRAFVPRLRW